MAAVGDSKELDRRQKDPIPTLGGAGRRVPKGHGRISVAAAAAHEDRPRESTVACAASDPGLRPEQSAGTDPPGRSSGAWTLDPRDCCGAAESPAFVAEPSRICVYAPRCRRLMAAPAYARSRRSMARRRPLRRHGGFHGEQSRIGVAYRDLCCIARLPRQQAPSTRLRASSWRATCCRMVCGRC